MTDTARLIFDPASRRIGIRTGKVELGQHVHEALAQMVATALGVSPHHLHICPVTTADSPDDGLTVGSLSVQVTGQALAQEVSDLARTLRIRAAQRMNVAESDVVLDAEVLTYSSGSATCDLFDLASSAEPTLIGPVADSPPLVEAAIKGQRVFLQDMVLPGMRHARALRGRPVTDLPTPLPDDCHLITDGGFAAIVATSEADLLALWPTLPDTKPTGDRSCDGPPSDWIKQRAFATTTSGDPQPETTSVTASRPFVLHASIAPSCAIAQFKDDHLIVWTHSQGIFPLRDQIARVAGLAPDRVELRHVPSAGSYGHNAADDAAADAAIVAMRVPGQPVRVAWPREDEVRHGPVGAPMVVEASATLDADRRIASWHQQIWSGPHGQRPGGGGHVNLLAAMERDPALCPTTFADLPAAVGGGASRNGAPIYVLPAVAVTTHIVQDLPVRSSSLRGLGTQMNIVAIEALMDRLALQAGEDCLSFRARHLDDPRASALLEKLRAPLTMTLPEDEAIGIALGRYKNKAAYAAVAARVRLEDAPQVLDLWAYVDAGHVVSRDGALNQIEGGMIQAASWTLREGVWLRDGQIDASGWADYPTLHWSEMPELHVELVDGNSDRPPLGVGECMVGPTSAAIVNALGACLGEPLADLPLN